MERRPLEAWIMPDGRFDPDLALAQFQLLSSYESKTLTAEELGIEDGQVTSVVVMAMFGNVWTQRDNPNGLANQQIIGALENPRITGSVKLAAGDEMEEGLWTDDSHVSQDGYSAISVNDVG